MDIAMLKSKLALIEESTTDWKLVTEDLEAKRDFRTPQIWGFNLSPNCYLAGGFDEKGDPKATVSLDNGEIVKLDIFAQIGLYEAAWS